MGSRLKRLRRAARATDATPTLTHESHWKEDLLCLNHLLATMGFPEIARQVALFEADKPGHFLPGVMLTEPSRSVALTLYAVPGSREAALAVWNDWRTTLPTEPDGSTFEREFFSTLFYASSVANADFVEALVKTIEAAGITIPELHAHEQSGRSRVPSA